MLKSQSSTLLHKISVSLSSYIKESSNQFHRIGQIIFMKTFWFKKSKKKKLSFQVTQQVLLLPPEFFSDHNNLHNKKKVSRVQHTNIISDCLHVFSRIQNFLIILSFHNTQLKRTIEITFHVSRVYKGIISWYLEVTSPVHIKKIAFNTALCGFSYDFFFVSTNGKNGRRSFKIFFFTSTCWLVATFIYR